MTRSTHIKSKKRGTRKRGTRKRGTRKPQSGGLNLLDWFPSFNLTKGDSLVQQSKDAELKQKLTTTLKELSNILPQVEICAIKSEIANEEAKRSEEARRSEEEARRAQAEVAEKNIQEAAPERPMIGGRISRRSGRGRAPPKGIPKGGPKGKKGVMVGPRKGPIIF